FFQPEDGIRCFHVTGVQTCALPISSPVEQTRRSCPVRSDHAQGHPHMEYATFDGIPAKLSRIVQGTVMISPDDQEAANALLDARSEERRVGNGWRYRWRRV